MNIYPKINSFFSNKKYRIIIASTILLISLSFLVYYIVAPILPQFTEPIVPIDEIQYDIPEEIAGELGVQVSESQSQPDGNRLIIPGIGVDTKIIDGYTLDVLLYEEGVWREPSTKPAFSEGSNTVIAGHRFQYVPPNTTTFYNLDKVAVGNMVLVYWENEPLLFEIYETKVVLPTQTDVRLPTPGETTITIYTCTPLGSDSERIVLKGRLVVK